MRTPPQRSIRHRAGRASRATALATVCVQVAAVVVLAGEGTSGGTSAGGAGAGSAGFAAVGAGGAARASPRTDPVSACPALTAAPPERDDLDSGRHPASTTTAATWTQTAARAVAREARPARCRIERWGGVLINGT